MKDTQLHKSQTVRVFISSTFRDMQAEREELVKRIFPQLRKICEQRGVTWGEVDLRWGVTDEQKAEGKVLPICLEEIKRCQPYFIGLLGERYGWVPSRIEPPELLKVHAWLKEHRERSVTEMEIVHGVLNDPVMEHRAFFYFRSPLAFEGLPPEAQKDFLEGPAPQEICELGPEKAAQNALERRDKLRKLKERIRAGKFPVREFLNQADLGRFVLEDLKRVIDEKYPPGAIQDPLDKEEEEHAIFAQSRFKVYVRREEYFLKLHAHVKGDGPPLVVTGESGSGKSALLASFAGEVPCENLLVHFIGSTVLSSDWAHIVRRIMSELKRKFGFKMDVPDDAPGLREEFPKWLEAAAVRGRFVLILDALNQLQEKDGAQDLVWLPQHLPPNVRLIASALDGKALQAARRRGWHTLDVEPLFEDERSRLIHDYLGLYRKELGHEQTAKLIKANQTGNPLFLRALLEELRLYGDHFTLSQKMSEYLRARNPGELFEMILARYEADYQGDRPGMVKEAMACIWASRRGLSEGEILRLLGTCDTPLPNIVWIPFRLAVEHSLTEHSGLLNFFHDYIRQAVRNRYVPSAVQQKRVHAFLARFFRDAEGNRKLEELPYQLAQAGQYADLLKLLSDLSFFDALWNARKFDLLTWWAEVEKRLRKKPACVYRQVLKDPERHLSSIENVVDFFLSRGLWDDALGLCEFKIAHYRRYKDQAKLAGAIVQYSEVALDRKESSRAINLLKEAEKICRQTGDRELLSTVLVNHAYGLYGKDEEALKLLDEATRLARECNASDISACYNNQAYLYHYRGEYGKAMELYDLAERLDRTQGDVEGVIIIKCNAARIHLDRGEWQLAAEAFDEAERIFASWQDEDGILYAMTCKIMLLHATGLLKEAKGIIRRALRLAIRLGSEEWLPVVQAYQGLLAAETGKSNEGIKLLRKGTRTCRDIYLQTLLMTFLAQALINEGRIFAARRIIESAGKTANRLGYGPIAALLLAEKARLAYRSRRPKTANRYLEMAETNAARIGYRIAKDRCESVRAEIRKTESSKPTGVRK